MYTKNITNTGQIRYQRDHDTHTWLSWYPCGQLKYKQHFVVINNKMVKHGSWQRWHYDGTVHYNTQYFNGKAVTAK